MIKTDKYEFEDTEYMPAEEKVSVLRAWKRFIKSGFNVKDFSNKLYNHLIMHCSFIAHFDRFQFWSTYFEDPNDTLKFLSQFDDATDCRSVEYGSYAWLDHNGYADINRAMVAVLKPLLSQVRADLKRDQIHLVKAELYAAQQRLDRLTSEV